MSKRNEYLVYRIETLTHSVKKPLSKVTGSNTFKYLHSVTSTLRLFGNTRSIYLMKRRTFLTSTGAVMAAAGCSGWRPFSQEYTTPKIPAGTMTNRELGKTGIRVSRLGFGSHLMPELVKNPKLRDRMIKLGYEGGITLFDVYNRPEYHQYKPMSESIRSFRKNIVLSLYAINGVEKLQEDIDNALRTFKTDYIDLYRFHVTDESVRIMERNRDAGKIRALGTSAHEVKELVNRGEQYGDVFEYMFIVYNFHHNKAVPQKNAERSVYSSLFPLCERHSISLLSMKTMGSDNMIALARKHGFFDDPGINIAQAMLRHVFANDRLDVAFTAMNSLEEVAVNLEAAYNPAISDEETAKLRELSEFALSQQGAYLPPHYRWLENWASRVVTV